MNYLGRQRFIHIVHLVRLWKRLLSHGKNKWALLVIYLVNIPQGLWMGLEFLL